MALIICPQCGKSISDKAAKCPHCGMAIEKKTIPSKKGINIPKIFLGVVVFFGGVMSIVPLFYDIWGDVFVWYFTSSLYDALESINIAPFFGFPTYTAPFFGSPTIGSYLTIAVGLLGGLSCIGLCILGMIRYSKGIRTTWLYWMLSVIFSIASAFSTFLLLDFANMPNMYK